MENKIASGDKKPVLTLVSLTLTVGANVFAWIVLVWTFLTVPAAGLFEYIPLLFAWFLLIISDLIGLLTAFIAGLLQESRLHLRRIVYVTGTLSLPLYFLAILILS